MPKRRDEQPLITVNVVPCDEEHADTATLPIHERKVAWPFLPRVGDRVLLDGSGRSKQVEKVWFDAVTEEITVDLGRAVDWHSEGLEQTLYRSGWTEV